MAKNKTLPALLALLLPLALCAQQKQVFSISGTIKDGRSGETLTGATIGFLDHPGLGVVTNSYGFYSISIPDGKYTMVVSFSGYATDTIQLDLKKNTVLNRSMGASNSQLEQVVVTSNRKTNNILRTPPGLQRLNVEDL